MKKNYDRQKITRFLYEKANNVSSRVLTYPKDYEKIKQPPNLDYLNLGADMLRGDWIIRVRFSGSQTWFEAKIPESKSEEWFDVITHLVKEIRNEHENMKEEETPW